MSLERRFWEKVEKAGPDECWNWIGGMNRKGYGRIGLGSRAEGTALAHRVSYEMHHGIQVGEQCVLHKCDNRACVNPSHLFLGTQAENMADMNRKGRRRNSPRKGESHWNAKLSRVDVLNIRHRHSLGETLDSLARCFAVRATNISAIVNRKTWTEV